MPSPNPYEMALDKNAANYVPLSPLTFIRRTAAVFPDRTAVIHGSLSRTWRQTYDRCVRLASALKRRGIGVGDTVAMMAPNIPENLEAHFGVPMSGAVLNALNIRLDADTIAFILQHADCKVLITDREFSPCISKALARLERRPLVIDIDDPTAASGDRLGEMTYEEFLAQGDPNFDWDLPADEWQAIALNYTSGTTGNPKGVVYHHRGAYLNAIGNILTWAMPHHPVYLWTLPMFHCNGWCFPWTVTAMAGTHVCLRRVTAATVYAAMADHGVTHLCGAPIVMGTLANAADSDRRPIARGIRIMTAGAAPPPAIIEKMQNLGFDVTHVYGLTESYGPVTVCAWHDDWNAMPIPQQAVYKARQGVSYVTLEGVDGRRSRHAETGSQRRRNHGRDLHAGQHRDARVPEESQGHRGSFRRRLVPHRRPRRDASQWIHRGERPLQGHHHLGRRKHFDDRGGGRALPSSRGAGGRGGRASRREMGRGALRLHHPERRRRRDGGRNHRLLPR